LSQERIWNKRVRQWHSHVNSSTAFAEVLDRLLTSAQPKPDDVCVDLGAGTGFVTLALAPQVRSVLSIDIAVGMTEALETRAAEAHLANVSTLATDLMTLRLPPASTDLIVSSYVLHHLPNSGKRALVREAAGWLRPGGRLVIADMMFGRGFSERDREVLRQKVVALAAKGPGGMWRIAKNLARYGLGVGHEHPASAEFWVGALEDAGFAMVKFEAIVAEAGLVTGTKP
jgi:ubiquinone/menaquinone biosynthesis C-methylase UbiE